MLRMPVATLRIWEQRHCVAAPETSPAGHRLYTSADVQRLALVKQLVDLGHAIGAVAPLTPVQLREVAATHAGTLATGGAVQARRAAVAPWRVAVAGAGLAARLIRPSTAQALRRPIVVVSTVESTASLASAGSKASYQRVDALIVESPVLDTDRRARKALHRAAAARGARAIGVVYRYASTATESAWRADECALLREPNDDGAFAAWLRALAVEPEGDPAGHRSGRRDRGKAGDPARAASNRAARNALALTVEPVGPRRYDDAALAGFAALSSTIACECPRHVAELLMQLSHFEDYSAQCASGGPSDAALHVYLERVAGTARALFESALEHVAVQEGLVLPG